MKKYYKYICIRKDTLNKLLKNYSLTETKKLKNKVIKKYISKDNTIIKEQYKNNLIIIKSISSIISKSLIDVSNNDLYKENNLKNVIVTNYILEGTDGVGKTTTIKELINDGIVCYDRDKTICKYMLFDIDMKTRCKSYENYFSKTKHQIIFMINNSKEELESRINQREKISEFDKLAFEYNNLYKDTYLNMKNFNDYNKLKLIDCTNLTIKEQVDKVKSIIKELSNE